MLLSEKEIEAAAKMAIAKTGSAKRAYDVYSTYDGLRIANVTGQHWDTLGPVNQICRYLYGLLTPNQQAADYNRASQELNACRGPVAGNLPEQH